MEKTKNSSVLIFILTGLLCLVAGYLAGTKLNFGNQIEKEENKEGLIEENKQENEDITYDTSYFSIAGPTDTVLCTELYNIILTNYNGDLYYNVKLGEFEGINTYIDKFYEVGTSTLAVNKINSYKRYENGVKGIKLNVSAVSKFITIGSTQTCTNEGGLVILKEDGTIYGISFYSLLTGKTELNQITELKDISDIKYVESCQEERCSSGPFAIDKSGNQHSILKYINIPIKKYNEW